MRRLAMGLALLGSTAAVQAEIYVCEDNGRKTYSQQPCGDNARPVTLQQSGPRITIPDQFSPRAAADICKIMLRSWEVAAQMRRQNIDMDRADKRVFEYLRESVTNFDAVVKRNPSLFTAFQQASRRVTMGAYANPNIQPGEREVASQQCTDAMVQAMERAGTGAASPRTSSNMM